MFYEIWLTARSSIAIGILKIRFLFAYARLSLVISINVLKTKKIFIREKYHNDIRSVIRFQLWFQRLEQTIKDNIGTL